MALGRRRVRKNATAGGRAPPWKVRESVRSRCFVRIFPGKRPPSNTIIGRENIAFVGTSGESLVNNVRVKYEPIMDLEFEESLYKLQRKRNNFFCCGLL
jgi:hypothetical protein